jgi:enhancer of yellow 2 transcription factor
VDRSIAARQRRDEQVKERIAQKLVDSGEKERLKELLREKLATCGWRDEMKAYCKGPAVDFIADDLTRTDMLVCASRGDPEQGH